MSLVFDYNHIFNVWEDYHDYSGTYYTIYNWLITYYKDLESKKDPQMDKAVEILKAKD